MKKFNLSDWALSHAQLVWYFMIIFALAGVMSYVKLGREEDPSFTIKTMIISAQWPGASVDDMSRQVTDRIEKKLQELPSLDYTRALVGSGTATIFVNLRADSKAGEVPATWVRVRNMVADIKADLPSGVVGPFFNDNFGDVYGNIYAFTGDGLSKRQLRDFVEDARSKVLTVANVGRVDVVGAESEAIYLEFSPRQLALFGVSQQAVLETLQQQNAVTPSGVIEAGPERVSIRVSGQFTSEDSLKAISLRVDGRFFRLSDVATVTRGYADPPSALFRYNGEPAIALAIGMKQGANLLEFGEALRHEMARVEADLPVGVGVHRVSDQPALVDEAVGHFTRALFEAVAIVLAVSFVSLGLRAGIVVALAIPLVLAITFVVMEYGGISLQRISLGALIIALGLLVDDAMIAVEMMVARLEAGDSLRKAATSVYTSTAFPMLTGTLVTVAGFIPIGLNNSAAGEFTFTMFVVIAVSLLVSWVVAVLFTPLLGVTLLPAKLPNHHSEKGRVGKAFSRLLIFCIGHRWLTIGLTVLAFGASIYGMRYVPEQFFPSSDRLELVVDWNLPQNASISDTNAQISRFEREQLVDNPGVEHWSSYVGQGAVRFLLSFDVQAPAPNFGQTIIVTKSLPDRDRVKRQFQDYLDKTFPNTDAYVKLLEIGPPVGRPVAYRISGPDPQSVRRHAQEVAKLLAGNPHLGRVILDWNEPSRVVKVAVLQDKARQLGVSSQDIAQSLNGIVGGSTITQLRDGIYQVPVIARAVAAERNAIETLRNLQLSGQGGRAVPLGALAELHYEIEQPFVWTRNRVPTITVRAGVVDATQPATVDAQLAADLDAYAAKLPAGYHLEGAGSSSESAKSQAPIAAVVPLMLLTMATVLMLQLQSFSRLFLVFTVAPLALVGVVAALLPSQAPLGFVAILGVLALIGILIRNSVILIVQIEDLRRDGVSPWRAVIEATEGRMRPIMLTAAAASLSLIPIAPQIFWGPMAYAMMGGIIVGTVLTLLFLPALYVAWFRLKPDDDMAAPTQPAPAESAPHHA